MELKDWVTIGISTLGAGIAGAAAYVGYLNYRIGQRQEARAQAVKLPVFDVSLPVCDRDSPWKATYKIINRSDFPLYCDRIYIEMSNSLNFYMRSPDISCDDTAVDEKGLGKLYRGWPTAAELLPGEMCAGDFLLDSAKRVSNQHPIDFFFSCRFQGQSEDRRFFKVSKTANP